MHASFKYAPRSARKLQIRAAKCPLALLFNVSITFGEEYGQKVSVLCSSKRQRQSPQTKRKKENNIHSNPNVKKNAFP